MDSDLGFPSSSPTAFNNFEISLANRFQADDTDDDVSPNGRHETSFKGKYRRPQASFTVTDHPTELPPALWAPSNNAQGVTGTGIRIAPQPRRFRTPIKRKHHDRSPDPHCSKLSASPKKWQPKDFDAEPSSEPEVFKKRPSKKPKHRSRSSGMPGASPRRRGRPYKPAIDPHSSNFSAHVYVKIANPPKLQRGKTHKSDKYVSQGPTTEGPFTFTHDMSWMSFLSQVATLAELEEENVALTQMTWHFQGKTKSLPLGSVGGFTAMVMQIRALKVGVSAIILLGIPVPPTRPSRGGRNTPPVTSEDEYATGPGAGDATQMWGKKV